jgi:hypothetical protein
VPELDRFQVLTEHAPTDLIYDPTYLGVKQTATERPGHGVSQPLAAQR